MAAQPVHASPAVHKRFSRTSTASSSSVGEPSSSSSTGVGGTGSSWRSSVASSSSQNGRLTPASSRLRIDVPDNHRFVRPASSPPQPSFVQNGEDDAVMSSGSSDGYGEVGAGVGPSRCAVKDDEDGAPDVLHTVRPSHSFRRHEHDVLSDDEDGGADFHDANEWFPPSLEQGGLGLGLGFAVPTATSVHERRRCSGDESEPEHAGDVEHLRDSDAEGPLPDQLQQRRGSLPFPSRTLSSVPNYAYSDTSTTTATSEQDQQSSRPALNDLHRSTRISTTTSSSNSSTLSLPTAPPVDLSLPNRQVGPYVSVANGPMASLASSNAPAQRPQPLCGAILDQKYLLIGTTAGLDFLPLPLPGSLPMQQLGKKRKETRKPVPLIKRTRFKELAVLSERSNILLAIAGRNDHVRVYALDGIRAMIDKKMQEIDKRDGYPIIHDAAIFDKKTSLSSGVKGKARAPGESRSADTLQPAAAASVVQPAPSPSYQFPPTASTSAAPPFASQPLPPDDAPTPTPRRRPLSTHSRPPSYHQRPPSWHQGGGPASPVRISSRPSSASFVRAVPTNPAPSRGSVSSQTTVTPGTPRTVRGQKSRDFIAGRKGSTAASMPGASKRRSRADLGSPPGPSSRRASVHSHFSRRGSIRSAGRAAGETADDETPPPVPSVDRRLSAPTHSLESNGRRPSASPSLPARLDAYPAPMPFPPKRMEPRPPVKPLNPLERSPTSDLAEFLRDSGPDMRSPEMDNVLASSRRRRRSSVTDNLLHAGADAQLFPALPKLPSRRESLTPSATASHLAGLELYTTGGSDLVEMLSEPALGDNGRASLSSSVGQSQPREARSPPLRSIERSPVLELADFIRQSGPLDDRPSSSSGDDSIAPPRVPPKPEARSAMTPRLGAGQKSPSMELAELLRQTGPVDEFDTSASSPTLLSQSSGVGVASAATLISSTRQRAESTSAIAAREAALDRLTARSPVVDSDAVVPTELAELVRSGPFAQTGSSSPSSRSSKRWTMSAVGSKLLHRTSTPESSRRPPSAGQNSASPLEYVKLARTRGARMLRATETKKRTYLAVLCGEEAERIELFTGSRSISLSLNRTFVLPETPRTIEFQMQGDDLVDIYLVYPESIFALEPATVRRERRMRDVAATSAAPPTNESGDEVRSPNLQSALHPADHLSVPRTKSRRPSMQLLLVNPALDDALADTDGHLPQPSITVTGAGPSSNGLGHQRDVSSDANLDIPLLSPISLLGGAAHRQIGPPGLFFVSKGQNLSGIVTADGKSVIKRPIVWGNDPLPVDPANEPPQRLEVLVLGGRRTVVVKLSPSDVKAISVEGASPTAPFSAATLVSPPRLVRPAIQFLATHSAGQQLVFAQVVGQSFSIQCLAAARI
ncbi:hypothetical protein Rhopal_004537-T1 [Rhodotorula paludigena]|uniref:CNH domain-containing protein n=1 Tax=Rhodotorula paludigena TaxID=86838 RepID=A0AAV5GNL0_9BASI|nr:hypothetical protein Rhopal_004537-T1 [Rhodotorula paludigena]